VEIRLHVHNHELNERVVRVPSGWLQHRVQHNPLFLALLGERRNLRQELLELVDLPLRIVDLSERALAVFAEEADRLLVGQAQELILDLRRQPSHENLYLSRALPATLRTVNVRISYGQKEIVCSGHSLQAAARIPVRFGCWVFLSSADCAV